MIDLLVSRGFRGYRNLRAGAGKWIPLFQRDFVSDTTCVVLEGDPSSQRPSDRKSGAGGDVEIPDAGRHLVTYPVSVNAFAVMRCLS